MLNWRRNTEGNRSVTMIFIVLITFAERLLINSNIFTMRYFKKNSQCVNNVLTKMLQFVILSDKLIYK
jgi:hypothetical protein